MLALVYFAQYDCDGYDCGYGYVRHERDYDADDVWSLICLES